MARMVWYELRSNLKSLLIWTAILILLVVIALAKYEGYRNNPEMIQILESMPKGFLDAFGVRALNLTTLEGFFGVMAMYYYLMGAMAAAIWGANAIAKEEYNRTADFTLVLPLPRTRILTAKALAALLTSAAFVLLTWAISLIGAQRYDPGPDFYAFLRLEMAGMAFIALLSWALGVALACLGKRPRRAASAAVIVVLVAYVLSTVQALDERLDFLKWFTPFKYFDAGDLYRNGALDGGYVAITLAATLALVAASYAAYARRDIAL
ncbi:MAG: hypothetical protein D6775_14210 [Caldilineae bacterium]|nr:MAG: hypothetical protein D6775_14210 [Caldilineae bacterium]